MIKIIKNALEANQIIVGSDITSIESILKLSYQKLLRPLIILDELDVVYYQFCKASLIPSHINQPNLPKFKEIIKFFLKFSDEYVTKGQTATVLVIVSLRESSYTLFRANNLLGMEAHHNHIIKLHTNCNEKIKDILIRRLRLKQKNIKEYISSLAVHLREQMENNILEETIDLTIEELQDNVNAINFIPNVELSVHGFRHLMNLFYKVEKFDRSGNLLRYLIAKPNELLLIYQFLDGALDYSQTKEGVSNIFLVNRDYKELVNPGLESSQKISQELLKDHLQTYFLKYLIIYLIYEMDRIHETPLNLQQIIEIFCNKLDEEDFGLFETEIVCLVILHATEADHGRLIRLDTTKNNHEIKCRCTKRAAKMIEKEMFWSFKYLMVIIEDEWIGFPKFLQNDFLIRDNWKRVFVFVTKSYQYTDEKKLDFIKYKAKLTFIFLTLLQVAASHEFKRYETAINKMRTRIGSNFKLPAIDEKIINLKDEIILFTESTIGRQYSSLINDYLNKFIKQELPSYKIKIEKYYKDYEFSGIYHLKKKMKSYYEMKGLLEKL